MISLHGLQDFKRRYPRVKLPLPADFRILLPNKDIEQYSLNIKSLSYGGLSFISPVPLKVGTPVEMTIFNFMDQITFSAEVTWTKKVPESQTPNFKCGLKFAQISDENLVKIYHIVNSYLANPNPST
jgi:c-di-GMP-binding flagellar brake protein YcgR